MSRRKSLPAQHVSAIPGKVEIKVVCTDRGHHPAVSFGSVPAWPDGAGWHVYTSGLAVEEFTDVEGAVTRVVGGDTGVERAAKTWPLVCRRCGRNVPLKESTIQQLCYALADARHDTLDISAIPT